MTTRLICADVLEGLAQLEAESVDCGMTSPPYWGLRKYAGEQDRVWGGKANCEHCFDKPTSAVLGFNTLWRPENEISTPLSLPSDVGKYAGTVKGGADRCRKEQVGSFCSLCGAWRGALGLEPTIDMYVAHMVEIMRAVRRVLKPTGTFWLNCGDSYAGGKGQSGGCSPDRQAERFNSGESLNRDCDQLTAPKQTRVLDNRQMLRDCNIKPLDLCGIPFRLFLALQADGWWMRCDVIWHKENPMPESVNGWRWERHKVKVKAQAIGTSPQRVGAVAGTGRKPQRNAPGGVFEGSAIWQDCPGCEKCLPNDGYILRKGNWRPTSAHEYIFQMAQSASYFSDMEAVREKYTKPLDRWGGDALIANGCSRWDEGTGQTTYRDRNMRPDPLGRNLRSVWTFPTQPMDTQMCTTCKRVYDGSSYRRLPMIAGSHKCSCGKTPNWIETMAEAEIELNDEAMTIMELGYQCDICEATYPESEWDNLPDGRVKQCRCGATTWLKHFATFPEALVEKPILASTSARGNCPKCGQPWARIVEKGKLLPDEPQYKPRGKDKPDWGVKSALTPAGSTKGHPNFHYEQQTLGWRATCEHGDLEPVPAVIFDPFMGSGTSLLVAKKLGRSGIGIDIAADYIKLAEARLASIPEPMRLY